jgi:hypothetical protein
VYSSGEIRHREFARGSGENSRTEFTNFLGTSLRLLANYSADGSIHFIGIDWRHMTELLAAGSEVYGEPLKLCVWNKSEGGLGSLYRSAHELVLVFKRGNVKHIDKTARGCFGRSNVWGYPAVKWSDQSGVDDLGMHPTVKPVALVADAICDCSRQDGIVLDSFGGSGTTVLAAERTGRRAYTMELDPAYVDVTIRRFQEMTGEQAIHAETRRTFSDTEQEQLGIAAPEINE